MKNHNNTSIQNIAPDLQNTQTIEFTALLVVHTLQTVFSLVFSSNGLHIQRKQLIAPYEWILDFTQKTRIYEHTQQLCSYKKRVIQPHSLSLQKRPSFRFIWNTRDITVNHRLTDQRRECLSLANSNKKQNVYHQIMARLHF